MNSTISGKGFSFPLNVLAVLLGLLLTMAPGPAASTPQFQSPLPGARLVLPSTEIIFRPGPPLDRASLHASRVFTVVGSESGRHSGTMVLAPDGRTLIFRPDTPFALGEKVTVDFETGVRTSDQQSVQRSRFEFHIQERTPPASTLDRIRLDALAEFEGRAGGTPEAESPRTVLDIPPDFPAITTQELGETAPGYVFLSNLRFSGPTPPYLMIIDNAGQPVFQRKLDGRGADFKVQPNGLLTYFDFDVRFKFYAMNSIYTVVDSFACGNGYGTDLHELQILPNGHALLMSYDPQFVDMSQVIEGGDPNAIVIGLVIQELDEDKNVVFQWRSWDHFQITDAGPGIDLLASEVDYVHGNAIDLDGDGNLLISSRNLDEITKIDRFSGNVIWRWGGKNNEFIFFGDTLGFWRQHAIRRTSTGTVTLYDNGNLHEPPFSRAVEYTLDEEHKIAALVWEFRRADTFGSAMGYVQRLPNGNTLIGWGAEDVAVTEVDPNGNVVFELAWDEPGIYSYRAFRFPWTIPVAVDGATGRPLRLAQNFPNPFHDRTMIQLQLARPERVALTVHDVAGRTVLKLLEGPKGAGLHRVAVDASLLDPGIYFCRLATEEGVESIKMILLD